MTKLYDAVLSGKIEEVRARIEAGDDVNEPTPKEVPGYYDYPLHVAVSNRDEEIVRLLLEAGAYVDTKDEADHIPMDYAKEQQDQGIIALLEQYKEQKHPDDYSMDTTAVLFLDAVEEGRIEDIDRLYPQCSLNEFIMFKAFRLLIDKHCHEENNEAFQSKWGPIQILFAQNEYYSAFLLDEAERYTCKNEQAVFMMGIFTRLYLKGFFELIEEILKTMQENDWDINAHPAIYWNDKFFNVLQMAILLYPGPRALPFIKNLVQKFQLSTRFTIKQSRMFSLYSKNVDGTIEPIPPELLPISPDRESAEQLERLRTIDNALELSVFRSASHKELIEYLMSIVQAPECLVQTVSRIAQFKGLMTRPIIISPEPTILILNNKSEADAKVIEMFTPFSLFEQPPTGVPLSVALEQVRQHVIATNRKPIDKKLYLSLIVYLNVSPQKYHLSLKKRSANLCVS